MYQQSYFVDKHSGTFADVLVAYGLATVLDEVLAQARGRDSPRRIWLRDAGPYYEVELPEPLKETWIADCQPFVLADFVQTRKASPPPDLPAGAVRDYEAGWERFRTYRQIQTDLARAAQTDGVVDSDAQRTLDELRPQPDFWIQALLGDYRMQALSIYNQAVAQWWASRGALVLNLNTVLKMTAEPGVDLAAVAKNWTREMKRLLPEGDWKSALTASQLFNPHQGKGQNRTKANALVMGNEKSFWLLEALKATGLWRCTVPRTVRDGDDRKTYVLAPLSITLGTHQAVFDMFAGRLWNETSVKMDCMAALLYAQTMVEYSEAGQYDELDFEGYGPDRVVAGFHVAQYKLLSRNAYTTLNLAFVSLPHWGGMVQTRADVQNLKAVIREHQLVVRNLPEDHGDGFHLLLLYRDFLSGDDLRAFLDFTTAHSGYLISQGERPGRRSYQFSEENLRRLIVNTEPRLSRVLETQGFKNIAYAIRHSTVIPQFRKSLAQQNKGPKPLYDIRYGLGQQLARKAAYREDFVKALTDFLLNYNTETSQVYETQSKRYPGGLPESVVRQMRKSIRTSDIDEVVELIEIFDNDSELIGKMLVAYGYARSPRPAGAGEGEDDDEPDSESDLPEMDEDDEPGDDD